MTAAADQIRAEEKVIGAVLLLGSNSAHVNNFLVAATVVGAHRRFTLPELCDTLDIMLELDSDCDPIDLVTVTDKRASRGLEPLVDEHVGMMEIVNGGAAEEVLDAFTAGMCLEPE